MRRTINGAIFWPTLYRVVQLKWSQLTFLLVTF